MRILVGVFLLLAGSLGLAQQDVEYAIDTIAGDGIEGFGGDGGAATSAQLSRPSGVAVDSAGNLFIADYLNDRIRKVDTSGIITTVAGNGTPGFSGDGGPATAAQFNSPSGIAVDKADNLYIADYFNNRIRRVDANTGIITTVAGTGFSGDSGDGGPATSAQLRNPFNVAIDSMGNIFFSDATNSRIRRVDANTGIITTVAGTTLGFSGDGGLATAAQLNTPYGIAVDKADNLYIADYLNNRIRRVDANTGIITTVAGTGVAGFNGDSGAATAAQLDAPFDVAIDDYGNLFIADYNNLRIRKVDTNGIITTIAGTGDETPPLFSGDGGLATNAEITRPRGIEADSDGNLFIVDTANQRIRRLSVIVANINNSGFGSLRYVLSRTLEGGTVRFDPKLAGQTITLRSDLPEITLNDLTIDASNLTTPVIVDGAGNTIFNHTGTGTLTVNNLEITRGNNTNGGGIASNGSVTLIDSIISGNTSSGDGGGIYSLDTFTATNSTISDNTATRDGGGIWATTIDATESIIANNSAGRHGGGIAIPAEATASNRSLRGQGQTRSIRQEDAVKLQISGVSITNNTANNRRFNGNGGGIYSGVSVNIEGNATVTGNKASNGGGIFSEGIVTIIGNTTIEQNEATGRTQDHGRGGGIFSGGLVTLSDNTIRFNSAREGGGIYSMTILTFSGCSIVGGNDANTGAQWVINSADDNGLPSVFDNDFQGAACPQSITFSAIPDKMLGEPAFNVNANSDSGLPVTLTSTTPNVCTVSNTTVSNATVTLLEAGECTITANQAGNETFATAEAVQQSFTVLLPDITFDVSNVPDRDMSNLRYGDNPVDLSSSIIAPPNVPVVIESITPDTCEMTDTILTLVGAGECVLAARLEGDGSTLPPAQQRFIIAPQPLAIRANDVVINAGSTPTYTATYTGFANGDDASIFTSPVTFSDDAPDYDTPGVYTITPSGGSTDNDSANGSANGSTDNYLLTYELGTLTVQSPGFGIVDLAVGNGALVITEGASYGLQVVLTFAPNADVTIIATPNEHVDVGQGANQANTLTFTPDNWNIPQTLTITAVDNDLVEGERLGTVAFATSSDDTRYNGLVIATISVTITDDEPAVTFPSDIAVVEGTTTNYDIAIDANPLVPITIVATPDAYIDLGAGASNAIILTFSDTTPQTIVLTAVDNTDIDNAATRTSIIRYDIVMGGNTVAKGEVIVTIADDDTDTSDTSDTNDPDNTDTGNPDNPNTGNTDTTDNGDIIDVLPGVDLGIGNISAGQQDVVLLSFKVEVPAGANAVNLGGIALAADSVPSIELVSNLSLYIDGGTRGVLDGNDVPVAEMASNDLSNVTFTFPTRTFQPNVPMWFIVVGNF